MVKRYARKVGVFILGWSLIILAVAIGWLPGPGGIPLALLGLNVLASEYVWAARLKGWVLKHLNAWLDKAKARRAARRARRNPQSEEPEHHINEIAQEVPVEADPSPVGERARAS